MKLKFDAKADTSFNARFSPYSYAITYKYDLLSSCLFGLIWSKCHLARGYCCASEVTLGKEIKVTRQTIIKRIKVLESAGLIDVFSRERYKNGGVTLKILYCKDELMRLDAEVRAELMKLKGEVNEYELDSD